MRTQLSLASKLRCCLSKTRTSTITQIKRHIGLSAIQSHFQRYRSPRQWSRLPLCSRRSFASRSEKDLYDILGVGKNASDSEIKKAYFKLAKQYHPDVNKAEDAQSKFAEISGAYETLIDKDKRAQYDIFGTQQGASDMGGGHGGGAQGFNGFSGLDDIFETLFGSKGRGSGQMRNDRNQPGTDIQVQETLTFMEAIDGGQKEFRLRRHEKCVMCQGDGVETG